MKRRDFLKAVSIGAAAFSLPGYAQTSKLREKGDKPNIVYIMIDELGYFELSCMGNKCEQNNIADKHPDILEKMKAYAKQSHTENLIGKVLDKEKRFKGHQFR